MSVPQEELDKMPVWQNHEHRITNLESLTRNMNLEFKEIKEMINRGNEDQKRKLDKIDNYLMTEFFHKKRTTHDTKMNLYVKIIGSLVGGGSFLYLVFEKLIGG